MQRDDASSEATHQALLAFVDCWRFVTSDVEFIVADLQAGRRTGTEREHQLLKVLRRNLSPAEWADLPRTVAQMCHQEPVTSEAWKAYGRRIIEAERAEAARAEAQREAARQAKEMEERQLQAAAQLERHVAEALPSLLSANFLDLEEALEQHIPGLAAQDWLEQIQTARADFFRTWCAENLGWTPDQEQASAACSVRHHVRLTARAGSGKTSVLVHRAAFLIRHCGVAPERILMLAFNNRAAAQMSERLSTLLGDGQPMPHVMTFHALAYALVSPKNELLTDDEEDTEPKLTSFISDILDDAGNSHESIAGLIRTVMLRFFRADLDREATQLLGKSTAEKLHYLRSTRQQSLNGDFVKSYGEKVIANFLFERGINYRYEAAYEWNMRPHRPDFTVYAPDGGTVIIEYFGLDGATPAYDQQTKAKREHWQKKGERLLEVFRHEVARPDFDQVMEGKLTGFGLPKPTRQTEEQIWDRVKRSTITLTGTMIKTTIVRARQLDLGPDDLRRIVKAMESPVPFLEDYIELVALIYQQYLDDDTADDFTGLIINARRLLDTGTTTAYRKDGPIDLSGIDVLMLDEYQDFNHQFQSLVDAIRGHSTNALVFAVGDDWQAINRFAGADLKYFHSFDSYFADPVHRALSTNYRSVPAVVQAGNALMRHHGNPGRPHRRDGQPAQWLDIREVDPTVEERERVKGPRAAHFIALERLVAHALKQSEHVHLLSRRRPNRDLLQHLRSQFPSGNERITASTAHKFKGKEADCVILADVIEGSYPLIHPMWIFDTVFGNSLSQIIDDERRLLYVALTRAKNHLYVLTDSKHPSPYLEDLHGLKDWKRIRWNELEPISGHKTRIFVSGEAVYANRGLLKNKYGFRWDPAKKHWYREIDGPEDRSWMASDWAQQQFIERVIVLTPTTPLAYRRGPGNSWEQFTGGQH